MIYDLDWNPAHVVQMGEEYHVPCVRGLAVVLPSHVDEGDNGPTGKHWHADTRFYSPLPRAAFDRRSRNEFDQRFGPTKFEKYDTVLVAIVRDQGEEITYERRTATYTAVNASGAVFTSLVRLYPQLGTVPSRHGRCVHHGTTLQEEHTLKNGDCLTCPAHGMRFTKSGAPRYVAPFFLQTGNMRIPAKTGSVEFHIKEDMVVSHIKLVDSQNEVISQLALNLTNGLFGPKVTLRAGDTFNIHLGAAWPSDQFCPSFDSGE